MSFQRTDHRIEQPCQRPGPMRAHPVPYVATGTRAAPNLRRRCACRGARLRHTWAPPVGDQGCPCSDCKPLDRAIRSGVRPKMPPRTAVPRAVPGMRLVAQRALSNMQPQRAVGAPILARCNRLSSARSILGRFCSNQNMSRRSHPSLTSPHHHQQQSSTLHATQSQYSRLAVFMYDPQQAVAAPTRGYGRSPQLLILLVPTGTRVSNLILYRQAYAIASWKEY